MLPAGLGALLPNLRELLVYGRKLTPAARTSAMDVAAALQTFTIQALSIDAPLQQHTAIATAQLRQLAKLPSLSAVCLRDSSAPTLFLLALDTQLTRLHLATSHRQCLPGTQTPTPTWRATLQQVARCTRLRSLQIPSITAEELRLVAPALQQLRMLRLVDGERVGGDGDAVVELLLGLPHLTSLHWESSPPTLRRWLSGPDQHTPCRWEQLSFGNVTVDVLAGLPMRSLRQPSQCAVLVVDGSAPAIKVRAAVANVTRPDRCPPGFRWGPTWSSVPQLWFTRGKDVTEHLQALRPLVAPLTSVSLSGLSWTEELVRVLGQVLPRTCAGLEIWYDRVGLDALVQVARSLPWLQRLTFEKADVSPGPTAILGYAIELQSLNVEGQATPRVVEVVVRKPACPEGVGEAVSRRVWAAEAEKIELWCAEQNPRLVLRVEW